MNKPASAADGARLPLTWLSEEERAWRERVREFAETRLRPHVEQMDREGRIAPGLMDELFAAGLMGIRIPKMYGGLGGSFFHAVLAIEELSRVCAGTSVYVDVQNALIIPALLRFGTGDQKRRYLPRLAKNTVGVFSISEEQAGSDAFALTTRAVPDGNGYVLTGRKKFASGALEGGLFLIFAKVEDGSGSPAVTAFLVERESNGLTVGEPVEKMGIRANAMCDVILDGVRVRKENVLGRVGEGNRVAMETLNPGRLGIAAQQVGLAQAALDMGLAYAQERVQFGKPIAAHQGVQFPLARTFAEVEAARLTVYNAARMMDRGQPEGKEWFRVCAMAKLLASEAAENAASRSLEIFGGNGYCKGHGIEKLYRDAKIGKIYEGTSNMLLRTIASTLITHPEAR
ncbi:acyl-CoA dehydrogenase family protein [Staphylospora marina]|uniref:acyl-CoA dehydrogenase family protein n=1 Tax=Staphylospora marina TaxID=2490858 RepID=UPI000F5BE119|nr:acyl-CoA dehydrogenase family protein [Staphylospora marina]